MSAFAMHPMARVAPHAVSALARVVAKGGPDGEGFSAQGLRFGRTVLASLAGSLPTVGTAAALSSAYASASLEAHGLAEWERERWMRLTLTWLAHELVQEAALIEHPTVPYRVAALGASLARESVGPESASAWHAPRAGSVDARSAAVRRALANAHEQAIAANESPFVLRALAALRRGLPVLSVGGASCVKLARTALSSTDRAAHADPTWQWASRPRIERELEAARALTTAAKALAREATQTETEVSTWLARSACELAASVAELGEWLVASATDGDAIDAHSALEEEERWPQPAAATLDARAAAAQNEAKTTQLRTEHTENGTMTQNPSNPAPSRTKAVLATLETDATDAAWRTAGSQFVKLAREPLVGVLSRHLAPNDESVRGRIAEFLSTEMGTALLSGVLSVGLTALPKSAGPVPERLARELRVKAMADMTDQLADVLMGPLRQVMMLYLQDPGVMAAAQQVAATADPPELGAASNVVTAAFGEAARTEGVSR